MAVLTGQTPRFELRVIMITLYHIDTISLCCLNIFMPNEISPHLTDHAKAPDWIDPSCTGLAVSPIDIIFSCNLVEKSLVKSRILC